MQKTDSAVMRSIDAADAGIGGKKQKYDFPNSLEGFKYGFNESKFQICLNYQGCHGTGNLDFIFFPDGKTQGICQK